MIMETILPGTPESYQENDPITAKLIDIRTNSLTQGDIEAQIEDLRWYIGLRDSGGSIPDDDRLHWEELDLEYSQFSDEQLANLISKLDSSEQGDYINQ